MNRQLHVQIGCKLGIRNRKDELEASKAKQITFANQVIVGKASFGWIQRAPPVSGVRHWCRELEGPVAHISRRRSICASCFVDIMWTSNS